MNTAEWVALFIVLGVIGFFALLLLASAMEWVNISVALSLKFIPAAKRQPRTAVDVKVIPVIPGTVEQPAAPSLAAARRTGT